MHWPVLPVLLPLLGGALLLLLRPAGLRVQRVASLLLALAGVVLAMLCMDQALYGQRLVYAPGNWPAPFGIVMVLDQPAAVMVLLTAVLGLGALWYAVLMRVDEAGPHFHVLFQMQLCGLNGAFLTGDAFNLFVFFEMMLLASYSLLLHGGGARRTVAGLHYVVVNLAGSTVFLLALGVFYGTLGTLNLADMALQVAQLPQQDRGLVMAAGLLLLVVFGLKAALFPLYLWLPAAYERTSAPVAALFAIMTKLGIYAIVRVHGTVFGSGAGDLAYFYATWVMVAGLVTVVLAGLGATAAPNLRKQVAYTVLGSVGLLLVATGLHTTMALAAALYYLVHSTLLAAGWFLLADVIRRGRGPTHGDDLHEGMRMARDRVVGVMFIFGAVATVGLPPLSGFFGKVWVLQAATGHAWQWVIWAVVLLGGMLLLLALVRSGSVLFYQARAVPDTQVVGETPSGWALVLVVGLWLALPLLVVFAWPASEVLAQAANQWQDVAGYQQAVLAPAATSGGDR